MANQQGFDVSGGVGSLAKLFKHYDRTKMLGADGEYYEPYRWLTQRGKEMNYNQSDIDAARTHLNYNLAAEEQPLPQAEFVERRLSQIYCHKNALRNGVVDWVVTLPGMDQYRGREREFFEVAYGFLAERYGRANVVSAYVHMDEAQPHMHFCFVPVARDEKHAQGWKLSRKAVNTCERIDAKGQVKRDTREFSRNLHDALERRICDAMGFDHAGIVLTDEQRAARKVRQNLGSPAEVKEMQRRVIDLEEEVSRVTKERDEAARDAALARSEAAQARLERDAAREELEGLKTAYRGIQERLARLYEAVHVLVRGNGVFQSLHKAMWEFSHNGFVKAAWEAVRSAGVDDPLGNRSKERRFVKEAEKSLKSDIEREGVSLDEEARDLLKSVRRHRDGGVRNRGIDAR